MKKFLESPKVRLRICAIVGGIGLLFLVFLIITEFVDPHNPFEPLILRIIYVFLCSIPVVLSIWGIIDSTKEIRNKT